jgi:hypothetical protein
MRPILVIFLFASSGLTQTPTHAPLSAPAITVEALEARLAGLEKGRAQTLATLSAYDGAIQECQYWLDLVKKAKTAQPAKPGDPKRKPEPPKTKPEAAKPPSP